MTVWDCILRWNVFLSFSILNWLCGSKKEIIWDNCNSGRLRLRVELICKNV
jgi:hypothetical protein